MYRCRARGIFRKYSLRPLVGDNVDFEITHEGDREGNVVEIAPRQTCLIRPAVANVDQALVVFAMKQPDPVFDLLDRFLVLVSKAGLRPVLAFNKRDLSDESAEESARRIYSQTGAEIFFTSTFSGSGIGELREAMSAHTTVLAGPSGAGKSSMINALAGEGRMETGSVSVKTGRGRQTTRHVELLNIGRGSFIIDTPGFSSLELEGIEPRMLKGFFPEFTALEGKCFFKDCTHIHEPLCAVEEAAREGVFPMERLSSYRQLYVNLEERARKRW